MPFIKDGNFNWNSRHICFLWVNCLYKTQNTTEATIYGFTVTVLYVKCAIWGTHDSNHLGLVVIWLQTIYLSTHYLL